MQNAEVALLDWAGTIFVSCHLSIEASFRDNASCFCAWLPAGGIAAGEGAPVTGARGTAGSSAGCKVRYAAICAPLCRHTQLHSPSAALSLCGLLQNCHRLLGMTAHLVFMGDKHPLSVHHLTCVKCRHQQLLEASKRWIGNAEELQERINMALDNPRPFGFITRLPKPTV